MKIVSYIGVMLFVLAPGWSGTVMAQERFFETLYDVPVMGGLTEISDMALSFDQPGGRIAEAGASTTSLSSEAVLAFYARTLPQMGWQALGGSIYRREGEKLQIYPEKSGASLVIRFSLEPLL